MGKKANTISVPAFNGAGEQNMSVIINETRTCPHCGRTLKAIGYTMYQVVFETCPCVLKAQRIAEEAAAKAEALRREMQASCSHTWTQVYECGYPVKRCTKCGHEELGVLR